VVQLSKGLSVLCIKLLYNKPYGGNIMPSKQSLINSHQGATEMLRWANETHDVCEKLVHVKKSADGSITVRCCMESDHNDLFEGSGVSKKDATADALSQRFPA